MNRRLVKKQRLKLTHLVHYLLQDIIPGPDETTPETMVRKQQMKQDLEKVLNLLCDREACILRLHYGLNGETPRSYEEIGRFLKLSREREFGKSLGLHCQNYRRVI